MAKTGKRKFVALRPGGFRKLMGGENPKAYHFGRDPIEVEDEHVKEALSCAPFVTEVTTPPRRKPGIPTNDWPIAALGFNEGICGPLVEHGVESVGDLKKLIATEGGLQRLFAKEVEDEILATLNKQRTSE